MIAEFEDTLNALLSNPEALGQIMSLAKNISGDHSNNAAPSSQSENSEAENPEPQSPKSDDEPAQDSPSPSLSDLISNLSSGLDPSMMKMLSSIMQDTSNGQTDKNLALLNALRPFLKEKRQASIDQAIQLAQISRIARVAFRTMKGGEGAV